MDNYETTDHQEDYLATVEPSFSIEPNEWLELDLESMCIN